MDRLRRAALLTRLVERLRQQGSWCGETHVQKATFLLQRLMKVPLEYEFILYKHGPFSFDLRNELTSLRADDLLLLEPQVPPYGPRMICTERSRKIQALYPKTLRKYEDRITFVAEEFGDKGVVELERLATALYVSEQYNTSADDRAQQLCCLKPHIDAASAHQAIQEMDRIVKEAKKKDL